MKALLFGICALGLVAAPAEAGPNAGGTLIVHNPQIAYTDDTPGYCGMNPLADCETAVTRIDGAGPHYDTSVVWKIYAAFPQASSPRLMGASFGLQYDPEVVVFASGSCGSLELPEESWPASGTGTSTIWPEVQLGHVTEIYWFAGYVEDAAPHFFRAAPHPESFACFADDAVPANLDRIFAFSSLGFGAAGILLCPDDLPETGACCRYEGCSLMTLSDCRLYSGSFYGGTCLPDPCPTRGACCQDSQCFMLVRGDCYDRWLGEGTTCLPGICDPARIDGETTRVGPMLLGMTPNPCRNGGTIRYRLASPADVRVALFDASGRMIRNLVEASERAGEHSVEWDGIDDAGGHVGSGAYFVRMASGGWSTTRPVIVVR
jgi:hypothetical protein